MTERRREAGILLPLFSLRGLRDWGIGELGDLGALCTWLGRAGHRRLQLLPFFEMAPGERSPYTALSAFAIDPIYLSMRDVEDFVAAGGETRFTPVERARIEAARTDPHLAYEHVRAAKRRALEVAFAHFQATEAAGRSARALEFERFRADEGHWLGDYTIYRACREQRGETPWSTWEGPLRTREPSALATAAGTLADCRALHEYAQWLAAGQWAAVRRDAAAAGVALDGDLPFLVATDSADVWARQDEFQLDASVGAPPDVFNPAGQDWHLPPYRWETMAARGFDWLGRRVTRTAVLFDGARVDHVVGYYRMYVRPPDGDASFVPADDDAQQALGEQLLGVVLGAAGAMLLSAEDLGLVPDRVRASLSRLAIPGYRVLRWEDDDGVFRDPLGYPALSVATTGTHDTSTLVVWWEEELDDAGRRALAEVPAFAALRTAGRPCTPAVRAALLDGLYAARSTLVMLPFQDTYGGRERINVPATVAPTNWGYRMPLSVEELAGPAGAVLQNDLRALAARADRA